MDCIYSFGGIIILIVLIGGLMVRTKVVNITVEVLHFYKNNQEFGKRYNLY